jgi:hypothetical protein
LGLQNSVTLSRVLGADDDASVRFYRDLSRSVGEDLLNKDKRETVTKETGIRTDDHGKVYVELLRRRASGLLKTGTDDQRRMANRLLGGLNDEQTRIGLEMASESDVANVFMKMWGMDVPMAYAVHGRKSITEEIRSTLLGDSDARLNAATGNLFAPTALGRIREHMAKETAAYKRSIGEGYTHEQAVKEANISTAAAVMAGFNFVNLSVDSPTIKNWRRMVELNDTITVLDSQILDLKDTGNYPAMPEEERKRRIEELQKKRDNVQRKFTDVSAANRQQTEPLLKDFNRLSDSAISQVLRMEVNKAEQLFAQENKETGGIVYKTLKDDQIRVNSATLRFEVMDTDKAGVFKGYKDKKDAVYSVEMPTPLTDDTGKPVTDKSGKPVAGGSQVYKAVQKDNKWFYYKPEEGGGEEELEFDAEKNTDATFRAGTSIFVKDDQGKLTQSQDYFFQGRRLHKWDNGVAVPVQNIYNKSISYDDTAFQDFLAAGPTQKQLEQYAENGTLDSEFAEKVTKTTRDRQEREVKVAEDDKKNMLQRVIDEDLAGNVIKSAGARTKEVTKKDGSGNVVKDAEGNEIKRKVVMLYDRDEQETLTEYLGYEENARKGLDTYLDAKTSPEKRKEIEKDLELHYGRGAKEALDSLAQDQKQLRAAEGIVNAITKQGGGSDTLEQQVLQRNQKLAEDLKKSIEIRKKEIAENSATIKQGRKQTAEINETDESFTNIDLTDKNDQTLMSNARQFLERKDTVKHLEEHAGMSFLGKQELDAVNFDLSFGSDTDRAALRRGTASLAEVRKANAAFMKLSNTMGAEPPQGLTDKQSTEWHIRKQKLQGAVEQTQNLINRTLTTAKGKEGDAKNQLPGIEANLDTTQEQAKREVIDADQNFINPPQAATTEAQSKPAPKPTGIAGAHEKQREIKKAQTQELGQPVSTGRAPSQPRMGIAGSQRRSGQPSKSQPQQQVRKPERKIYDSRRTWSEWLRGESPDYNEKTNQALKNPAEFYAPWGSDLLPPVTRPPVTQPPVTQPPVAQPPVTQPTRTGKLPKLEVPQDVAGSPGLQQIQNLPPLKPASSDSDLLSATAGKGGIGKKNELTLTANTVHLNIQEANFKNGNVALTAEGHGSGRGFSPTMLPS